MYKTPKGHVKVEWNRLELDVSVTLLGLSEFMTALSLEQPLLKPVPKTLGDGTVQRASW
jgi:hypothetical protein